MKDLSLHVLDIAENSIAAGATAVEIVVSEDAAADELVVMVRDNGGGMDPETARAASDPFFTTKQDKKVGLGLALFAQSCREAGGSLTVESSPQAGTAVKASLRLSHPDRKPLGDMERTVWLLQASHPEVEFSFRRVPERQQHARDPRATGVKR